MLCKVHKIPMAMTLLAVTSRIFSSRARPAPFEAPWGSTCNPTVNLTCVWELHLCKRQTICP